MVAPDSEDQPQHAVELQIAATKTSIKVELQKSREAVNHTQTAQTIARRPADRVQTVEVWGKGPA